MKKKKSTILGVALTLMLLGSLLAAAVPVSAGTLSWTTVTIPSTTNEVLEAIDVTSIAVYDADTIIAGSGAGYLYKTTDGGLTWSTVDFNDATGDDTDLVAVAPDDADIIAVADTTDLLVWVTTNGGTTWGSLGTIEESGAGTCSTIRDIAISAESAGIHYVAVAGIEISDDLANAWYYDVGAAAPAWIELNDKEGFSTTRTDVAGSANITAAVAFSPNFPSDKVLVAVIAEYDEDGGTDNITLEMFSFATGIKKWNAAAGFTSYPVTVVDDDGITGLTSASISLAPDYLGSDDALRMAFVGLNVAGNTAAIETSGIYRADDTSVKALKTGNTILTYSIAYDGTNLVAGRYDDTHVWRSADPTATTPTVSTASSLKRPGGVNRTVVAWAGDDVVAATSGDESAFAVSKNDGKSFNDISLIDTDLDYLSDVFVSPDGTKIYLTAADEANGDLSLWRYASAWERVLSVQDADEDYIVRIAPDDADVVYVADKGGTAIYYSSDAGDEKWHTRTCGVTLVDLAVEGAGDVAYALKSDGYVSTSENSGFTWATAISTKLGNGHMIVSIGVDKLLVGGTEGWVSYSTDSNDSWTKIAKIIETGALLVQTTASGLADDDYIYAASSLATTKVLRWQVGVSTSWTDLEAPTTTSYKAYGIALQDGVLYVLTSDDTDSAALRTLTPTADAPSAAMWSTMATTAADDVAMTVAPQGLRVTAASDTNLWVCGIYDSGSTAVHKLYSYTDTIVVTAPTLVSPATGLSVKVNPVTGYAFDVTFSWEKPSAKVTGYQLRIAYDEDFDEIVKSIKVASTSDPVSQVVGKDISLAAFTFMPDTTYYWKVRVYPFTGTADDPGATAGTEYGPTYGPYSEVRSITIESPEVAVLVPEIKAPAAGATSVSLRPGFGWTAVEGATKYELELSTKPGTTARGYFVDVLIGMTGVNALTENLWLCDRDLDYATSYFWQVKAIGPDFDGDWTRGVFTTMAAPVVPPPPPPPVVPPPIPEPITPTYIWAIIIIGAILMIAVIVLIVRTRRVV